ncbi:PhzF family phenazine biosynthesis protein [bacterium]|jgi:PhzF family phenazine biosynthesis protein|nr:PhzF family phenazine biosynthesis protein [bacterium]
MIKIYVVDAFVTDKPFSGNPAGVCLLDSWESDQWMQQVASEMKHSETAFIVKNDTDFSIRFFTPTVEVPLCGHATLASAFILWEEGVVPQYKEITLHANGETLTAKNEKTQISIDFPSSPVQKVQNFDKTILKNLSINPVSICQSENDMVFELESEKEIKNYTPDFHFIKTLPFRMLVITARSDQSDLQFVSRVFAPTAGVDEDPATGIAHCILGPIWSEKLNEKTLKAFQASERGAFFDIQIKQARIVLAGKSRLVLKGSLFV